jgi:hypothetical protein
VAERPLAGVPRAALRQLEALDRRSGLALLFCLAVVSYALQSVALPLVGGRDFGTYLRMYSELGSWRSIQPMAMLFRTPVAPVLIGVPLDVLGGLALQVLMGLLYAGSIVAWVAAASVFGRRAALLVAGALLLYPGYAILFHTVASDSVFAAVFALWALLLTRAVTRPSPVAFGLVGAATAMAGLTRPANQALLVFAVVPFFLRCDWRLRLPCAASFAAVAIALLGTWAVNNGLRYHDFTVARGAGAYMPFFPAFVEHRIVEPENGAASHELAAAVEEHLLGEEPYRSYGIETDEFFGSPNDRFFEDLIGLSDRLWGWDSDYAKLRAVGLEAVRAHPGSFLRGTASTVGALLWKPVYVELPPAEQSWDADSRVDDTVVVDGRVLPRPSEGAPIPAAHQGFYSTTPDGWITEVWTSPTDHEVVFERERDQERFVELRQRVDGLRAKLPPYEGHPALALWLSRSSRAYPRAALWLVAGALAVAIRRPGRSGLALAIAAAAGVVVLTSALSTYAIAEIAAPVVPAFVVLAAAGLVGERPARTLD